MSDDDESVLPVFSITSVTASVAESNSAQFRLTTPIASTQPVVVKYNVLRTGGYLDGSSIDYTTIVEANSAEKIFDVGVAQDSYSEPDSIITVTLLADETTPATYTMTPDSANQSAEVTVIDDDPVPEFMIENVIDGTLEPGLAMFYLKLTDVSTVSSVPITVRINVTQTGDVLSGSAGERTIIMPAYKDPREPQT